MQIGYALERLRRKGYLIDEGIEANTPTSYPIGGVSVRAVGDINVVPLVDALSALNLLADHADAAELDIVMTDDELHPDLDEWNRSATRAWMLVKPFGSILWIAPVFVPGETACWACFARRVRDNRPIETFLEAQTGVRMTYPPDTTPSGASIGIQLAAHEAMRWLNGERHLSERLYTFDTVTMRGEFHPFVWHPACPICGSTQIRNAEPIRLESRLAVDMSDAGSRSAAASTTLGRYNHHIDPITGIVTHLARVQTPEHIYLYASGHNKARPLHQWQNFKRHLRSQSAGKGTDDIQARASALCEAIERYSGTFQGDEPRITARLRDLDGAIHPRDLLLFSDAQYTARETWNAHCPPHLFVPAPFDEEREIEWSPVWSLRDQDWKYVPTAYAYYDAPQSDDTLFCGADSNGCAAGSSREDAILQAMLELIERDAVAIWWDNRVCRPAFDLDALDHPYVERSRAYFARTGRDLWLLDITTDFNVPCFVAVSMRTNAPTADIVLGFGAHLNPRIAALRAITELNQTLPAALRDGEGEYQSDSAWEIRWWRNATIETQPYLAPDVQQPLRTLTDYPAHTHGDIRANILSLVELARIRGIDTLILDQTRADTELPVVRAIMPGMRHFWARRAPGRLYDVPVQLGWLDRPRAESELNDMPMFM